MRAWQITELGEPEDVLGLVDLDPPAVGEGLLRIRVDATGLGLPDVFMCRGSYAFKPELPFTPGQEVVGHVVETCDGGPPVGTRVAAVTAFFLGNGGFAEEALALAASTYAAPAELSDLEAAGFCIPLHTAWIGLVSRGRIQAGETVLVTGAAGSSGAAAIQLAKHLGARVIASARGEEKGAYCRALGADEVIDHAKVDLAETVNALTGGRGAEAIYEVVGGETFMTATRCVASEGRILAVGFASGAWANASTARLVQANAGVLGVYVGAYDHGQMTEIHEELLGLHAQGAFQHAVTHEWPFEELPTALQALADRGAIGKSVLRVSG